jgi:F-type H+-transporting ATPase subunit alpha
MEILKQDQYAPLSIFDQIVALMAVKNRYFKTIPVSEIRRYEKELIQHVHTKHQKSFDELVAAKAFSPELEAKFKDILKSFSEEFERSARAK